MTEVNETEEKLWTKANAGAFDAYRFPMNDSGNIYSVVGQGEETNPYNTATWEYMLYTGMEAAKAMTRLGETLSQRSVSQGEAGALFEDMVRTADNRLLFSIHV